MEPVHDGAAWDRDPPQDRDVSEILLLLPAAQAAALEAAARRHGLTLGRVLRALINEYLHHVAQGSTP